MSEMTMKLDRILILDVQKQINAWLRNTEQLIHSSDWKIKKQEWIASHFNECCC